MSDTETQTVLAVRNARKRFADTEALVGVDLTLGQGEWLGLLGPNGAGKTTLVRSIAGHVRLDEGRVEMLGTRLETGARPGARKRLGIVPQDIALYGLLTARENLHAFGRLQGVGRSELRERSDWALDWSGLSDHADQRTRTFSGGMKRRLNIACAVLHEPEVLLLDEPTAGVDPQSRQRIWEMLEEQRRSGASILLTTHQLDEAQQVCDRVVIIDHGAVIAEGTLHQLIEGTVGRSHRLHLALDRPLDPAHPELVAWHPESGGELDLITRIDDPTADLPGVLRALQAADRKVVDLRLESPSLQAVFLHLTGRELRP